MDFSKAFTEWKGQSTTGTGAAIIAGVITGFQSGAMDWQHAIAGLVVGAILLAWPQRSSAPAVASAAGTVTTDLEQMFAVYRAGLLHGASVKQAAFGALTDTSAVGAVSDLTKLATALAPVSVASGSAPASADTGTATQAAPGPSALGTAIAGVAAGLLLLVVATVITACSATTGQPLVSTASLQAEAQRLAYINQISCSAAATAQPILVDLVSTGAVVAFPGDAAGVAAAVAGDNALHAKLQALCPMGTQLLQSFATATPTVAATSPPSAPAAVTK